MTFIIVFLLAIISLLIGFIIGRRFGFDEGYHLCRVMAEDKVHNAMQPMIEKLTTLMIRFADSQGAYQFSTDVEKVYEEAHNAMKWEEKK